MAPDRSHLHFLLGDSLLELGRQKQAIDALKRVGSDAEPAVLAEASYRLGRAYYDLDQGGAAAAALARATRTAQRLEGEVAWLAEAYRLEGYAHKAAGNRRQAVAAWKAYLDMTPKSPYRDDVYNEYVYLGGR
jgi:tetratricopeptide (TPR) repeat protein